MIENNVNNESVNPLQFKEVSVPKRPFQGYEYSSRYLTMRDGVKIAITLVLPKNLTPEDKISIVLTQTRYWRDYLFRIPFRWFIKEIPDMKMLHTLGVTHGFGFVYVDVRGSGASFGKIRFPWSDEEVKDGGDIIDWITSQPWSNGNVVALGGSYTGTAAEHVATLNHPAVKGIIARCSHWDVYTEVAFPGGAYNHFFIRIWGYLGKALDMNNSRKFLGVLTLLFFLVKGVKPIDSDKKGLLLKEAIQEHTSNLYVFENEDYVTYRDDLLVGQKKDTADAASVFPKIAPSKKSNVPFYIIVGWLDGATADAAINRFMNYTNPMRVIIGDWDHSQIRKANPYFYKQYKPLYNLQAHQKAHIDFFNACMFGKEPFSERELYYYTMGMEKWQKTGVWPPSGHSMQRLYLSDKNTLSTSKPLNESGEDSYQVDFEFSAGKGNRWHTHFRQKMYYKNIDEKLLTYTSLPLENDMEITGHPIISLYLTSTHEDGMIIVYLEDVDENGKAIYITEGVFRFIYRKISTDTPPYKTMVPYHSFKRKDSAPLVPGEISEITFGALPASILIRKGHRLRIAITGADKDTFFRYPAEENPTISIKRDLNYASYIDIPIIKKI